MTLFSASALAPRRRVRVAAFAGASYPSNARLLERLLDEALERARSAAPAETANERTNGAAVAVIAPHIDFRVGLDAYAPVYEALRASDADVFVVFATSHYAWGNLFIPTLQHFATPLGVVRTDEEIVSALYSKLPRLARNDEAHREEHSIEFEAVWLQRLFGHRPFTIVPVLVTSFYPFIAAGRLPSEDDTFTAFIAALQEALRESGKKAAWLASGDMAHVGRKFDDPFDAEEALDTVRCEDEKLLALLERADSEAYFRAIAAERDAYKICGLPPVYSMLQAARLQRGKTLSYDLWHEEWTRSAVSYAGVAYYPLQPNK